MNKLSLILLILFASNAMASSLPNCPSDQSKRYHNCFGTYTYVDGDKYIGEWKDDKIHGQGTYTYADGSKYVGEYIDNKRNGQGTYTYANGEKYVGEYKDDKIHGQGTYTYPSGAKYVGEYKDDKRHGQGTYTFPDGAIERGYFMNEEYVPDICEEMSLTKGTESFGQCVVELIKQIREDD
jgi:hypothetical protein